MMILYYETSLFHHGIKGQKWGVRRFQNEDGSLTAKGKQRYDDSDGNPKPKKKSKHRLALEKHYLDKGLSQSEAEQKAAKRIKTEKIVGVAAGVTVAAGAAYLIHRHLKGKADEIVKAGTELQRIEMNGDGVLYDGFYAAKNRGDKYKYAGFLGLTRNAQTGHAYLMKIGVDSDVKVAGQKKATEVFKQLYKNDEHFRYLVKDTSTSNVHGGNNLSLFKELDMDNLSDKHLKKMYENFNSRLVVDKNGSAVTKFYNALKSEGYGAIRDINDMKFSDYKAKNPLIFLDAKSSVSVKSVKEMTDSDFGENIAKAGATIVAEALPKLGMIGTTAVATGVYADSAKKHASATKRK